MQTGWTEPHVHVADVLPTVLPLRSRLALAPAQASLFHARLTAVLAWLLRTHRLDRRYDS